MAKSTYYFLKAIFLAIVYFISLSGAQAQVHLVKDFNTTPQSSSAYDNEPKQAGNVFYFPAYTNQYGRELWKSDGTENGTVMVKDIMPGYLDGRVQNLTMLNGILYFTAADNEHGNELWRSDGTAEGTYIVKDFHEGTQGTNFWGFAVAGGSIYIAIHDGKFQLWKTDGVETTRLKEFSSIGTMVPNGNSIYFSGDNFSGESELWRSDGTTATTAMVKDISGPGVTSGASNITVVNGTIYFNGYTIANGSELWKSDGTAANTVMVKDIAAGTGNAIPRNLTPSGNKLYFTAMTSELWVTDGTTTTFLGDTGTPSPSFLGVNGSLYFTGTDSHGTELWSTNGTVAGTNMVSDIAPGAASSNPTRFTLVNGSIFFTANDAQHGIELWKSDGTNGGTAMVKDIRQPVDDVTPTALIALGQDLYFWADDVVHGNELWVSKSNGETRLVKDIATGSDWAFYDLLITMDNNLWFTDYNTGIWNTDGTDAGTSLLFNAPRTEFNQYLRTSKGTYVVARKNDNTAALYLFDGASSPIEIATNFVAIQNLVEVNGVLYFAGEKTGQGRELWKSNGALNDATLVMDIRPGTAGSNPKNLVNHNGVLYFTADEGVNGEELWKCEGGTALGTRMIKDIYPGAIGSNTQYLTSASNGVYFTANDPQYGIELWITDGTEEGTHLVVDAWPGQGGGNVHELVLFNNKVYFFALDLDHGYELWVSDGTTEGSHLLKDTYPGNDYLDYIPDNLVVVNGSLYMSASDGVHGVELWKSDGTEEGTFMVKDLTPGPAGSEDLYGFSEQDGHLVFVSGNVLWRSNGTECSTLPLFDSSKVSYADYLTPVTAGHKMYFYGTTPESGGELYYYDFSTINDPGCTQTVTFEEIGVKTIGDASFELHATSSAGLPVTFSANNDLVSIEGNIVTIHAAGDVIIRASQAGDINYAAAFAEQSFTIRKKQQSITFAALPEKIAGEAPFNLAATTSSGLAVVYTSSNSNIATISGSTVTITGPGEVSITATQPGNNEYAPASPVTQTMIVKVVTGLEETIDKLVSVYPNPATEFVMVDGSAIRHGAMLSLLDINGRVINSTLSDDQFSFDVRDLSNGIYFIKITTDKFSVTKRIVKK